MRRVAVCIGLMFLTAVAVAATTFSGRLVVMPNWTHAKTAGASTLTETFTALMDWTLTTGTNANQMATIVVDSATLTNGEDRVVDLMAAENAFGDVVSFTTVRFIALDAAAANLAALELGGAVSNAFTSWCGSTGDVVCVRPGGLALFAAPDAAGYAVDGTNGLLRVRNAGTNTVSYQLYIGGNE